MTTYEITVNETEKATTTNFNTMVAFVRSFDEVEKWSVTTITDGIKYPLSASGINCMSEFTNSLEVYSFGRSKK